MRKHKKDLSHRAYCRGYQVAIRGRAKSLCPYQQGSPLNIAWTNGWQLGHNDYYSGFSQATLQQKACNL
ncbi:MAG: ribosome modulation factor [Porticoccaceae bacterium]|jgi:ribosome modulation factor